MGGECARLSKEIALSGHEGNRRVSECGAGPGAGVERNNEMAAGRGAAQTDAGVFKAAAERAGHRIPRPSPADGCVPGGRK